MTALPEQKKWLRPVVIGIAGLLVLALAIWGVRTLMGGKSDKPKQQPKLTLMPDKPPPPPKEEKKPEPPKKEQKEIKPQPAVPQRSENQAIKSDEAPGNDSSSPFQSARVNDENLRPPGSSLTDPFNAYGASIKGELQRFLAKRSELKRRQYKVEVRVWVGEDGRLKRFELLGTSDDSDIDDTIRSSLAAFTAFSEAPPTNMPQPIRLRITAGGRA